MRTSIALAFLLLLAAASNALVAQSVKSVEDPYDPSHPSGYVRFEKGVLHRSPSRDEMLKRDPEYQRESAELDAKGRAFQAEYNAKFKAMLDRMTPEKREAYLCSAMRQELLNKPYTDGVSGSPSPFWQEQFRTYQVSGCP